MVREGDKILVGVSGGADSVCLLLLLHALQRMGGFPDFSIRVLHVHHGLRESADADQQYVVNLCASLGVPCTCVRVDAAAYSAEHRCGVEEAARILRYDAMEKSCEAWDTEEPGCSPCHIAVAHHLEDQAETVLFHMVRGSRMAGLLGMRAVSGRVIRPLLDFTREEIEAYLLERGAAWREDETNEDIRYSRNLMRREIMPLLTDINRGAQRHIVQLAAEAAEMEDFLQMLTREAIGRCAVSVHGEEKLHRASPICIDIPALLGEPPLLQRRILYTLLAKAAGRKKDLQDAHVRAILGLCGAGGSGRLNLPGGVCAVHEYDRLWLVQSGEGTAAISKCGSVPEDLRTVLTGESAARAGGVYPLSAEEYTCRVLSFDGAVSAIPQKKYTKWLNYDKIATLPVFRTRLPGDRIGLQENGEQTKKLARYMIDAKIPAALREYLVFPTAGQEILWIPGGRIHAGYKVTPRTRQVLEIRWLPGVRREEADGSGQS